MSMPENVRLGASWLAIAEPCFLSWSLSFDERMSDRSSVTSHNQAAERVVAAAILTRSRQPCGDNRGGYYLASKKGHREERITTVHIRLKMAPY